MDVKITLIDEGQEGRKVMVTVADDKGTNVSNQELQTVAADSTEKPTLPTETQLKLPAGGSVRVVEEASPLVYDGDQRATYHPDSDAAKEQKAEEEAKAKGLPSPQPTVHPKTGREPEQSRLAEQPAKTSGNMTADEAQKAHMQGQAEAQKTGVASTSPPPQGQTAKVDEKKGTVDMSKTVSPSPTHPASTHTTPTSSAKK